MQRYNGLRVHIVTETLPPRRRSFMERFWPRPWRPLPLYEIREHPLAHLLMGDHVVKLGETLYMSERTWRKLELQTKRETDRAAGLID
jgi:hypothetical protein